MFWKKHVHDKLYDFLSSAMAEEERLSIENHLLRCPRCSEERSKVEQALKVLRTEMVQPPDLPESYWEQYWRDLQGRLRTHAFTPSRVRGLFEGFKLHGPRILSHRVAYGLIGCAIGAVITLAILSPYLSEKEQTETILQQKPQLPTAEFTTLESTSPEASKPLIQFFQRTKAFLIAVKNLDKNKQTERLLQINEGTSKELATECLNLRRQSPDPQDKLLLSELDLILLQLSKITNENDYPKLETVKEEITRNDLLMKIRIHELAHEARLQQATQKRSNRNNLP